MQKNEFDKLDEAKVRLNQFFALQQCRGLENIALCVDPDTGEAFLGSIEYFRDVS